MRGSILTRIIISLLIVVSSTQFVSAATLNDLNSQLQQKQRELDASKAAAANKAKEAKTLSTQINNLTSDIELTEQKITETGNQVGDVTSAITTLSTSIDQQNEQLATLKKKLNSAVVEIYRFSNQNDWQLIFGSDNFGEQSNQAKYIEAVEIQVKSFHSQVTSAKNELEKQKADQEAKKQQLSDLQNQQQSYVKGAQYQKTQKDQLLGMTVQQQQSYLQEAEKSRQEVARVEEQIRAALSSRNAGKDGTFGKGPGVGSRVKRGDYVGTQGSTGFSTGDHVHFEVDLNGPAKNWTNPHPYINSGVLSWPLSSYRLTQDYGEPSSWYKIGYHMGIDIAGPHGSPVLAPADGMVVLNESFGGYGNAWAMKVDNGPYVLLGHLR